MRRRGVRRNDKDDGGGADGPAEDKDTRPTTRRPAADETPLTQTVRKLCEIYDSCSEVLRAMSGRIVAVLIPTRGAGGGGTPA